MTRRRSSYWLPAALPAVLAVVALVTSRRGTAVVLAVVVAVLAALLLAGVDVAAGVQRAATRLASALFSVVTGILFALVFLPGWAVTGIRHRYRPTRASSGWATSLPPRRSRGLGASEGAGGRARAGLLSRVTWAIGCLVLLLTGNYGVGWAWDATVGQTGPDSLVDRAPAVDRTARPRDPRNDSPAMASSPWRARYFDDLQRTPGTYWPYTEYKPLPFSSPYINIGDWARRSYRGYPAGASVPTVWMFGGSTTFGEGQRDGYTIASWMARQAEQEGTPIRIVNYGQRGWTLFQEVVLFEEQLAATAAPDAVLFYDGANEINTQSLVNGPIPTHYQVAKYTKDLAGTVLATQFRSTDTGSTDPIGDLWYAYSRHSALHKLARLFRSHPADAAPLDDGDAAGPSPEQFTITAQDGTDAAKVYQRAQFLAAALARRHHVPSTFIWQPVRFLGPPERAARRQLRPPTIDLSTILLDHQDVYVDGAHTNEKGAHLVAGSLWPHLRPTVGQWYQDH